MQTLADVAPRWEALRGELDRIILGQDAVKEQSLVCLLAGGHALLEGVPGTGKTLLVLTRSTARRRARRRRCSSRCRKVR
jgi:MoxR-like ATPase